MVKVNNRHLAFVALIVAFYCMDSYFVLSQGVSTHSTTGVNKDAAKTRQSLYRDEYSDLDESSIIHAKSGEEISGKFAIIRQKYLKALGLIERGDTLGATRLFDQAIVNMNELASYPGIESNDNFADLAVSLIEDYESYIQNIDNLSETSDAFILRDKLFKEIDSYSRTHKPSISSVKPQYPIYKPQPGAGVPALTIPLDINESVEKSVAFLTQDRGRKFYKRWLERGGRFFPMMRRIAKEEGMPEEIIYLSMIESALNPNAVSRAKAVGLWQFMQSTGEMYDLQVNMWVDERRDPEKSTRAAMRHLRDLYNELGDWHLALASYNYGVNGVKRAIAKSNLENPKFWDIIDLIPRETRNYVPLYIAATLIALNPEAYGFTSSEINYEPEYQYVTFPVSEPISIKALAKCAQISVEDLKLYNPELVNVCTPSSKGSYNLKIPIKSRDAFASYFSTLTDDEKRPWIIHEVKRGETLAAIARIYNVTIAELNAINQLSGYKSKLKKGITLRVPISEQPALIASADQPLISTSADIVSTSPASPAVSTKTDMAQNNVAASVNQSATIQNNNTQNSHLVKPGETLYSIARRYEVKVQDLRTWNNMPASEDNVKAGSRITISLPLNSIAATTNTAIVKSTAIERITQHKVRRSETLAQIADDYDVSIEVLRKVNKLGKKRTLTAGMLLQIPSASIPAIAEKAASERRESRVTSSFGTIIKTHKVKRGENISIIAGLYGVKEDEIRTWNPTIKKNIILAGNKLKIYTAQSAKGSTAAPSRDAIRLPKHYKVRKGDTLSDIAEKFGVSITVLQKKNKNLSATSLRAGQTIRLQ